MSTDRELEQQVNRIIGTAILKNDKNYSGEILALIASTVVSELENLKSRRHLIGSDGAGIDLEDIDGAIAQWEREQ